MFFSFQLVASMRNKCFFDFFNSIPRIRFVKRKFQAWTVTSNSESSPEMTCIWPCSIAPLDSWCLSEWHFALLHADWISWCTWEWRRLVHYLPDFFDIVYHCIYCWVKHVEKVASQRYLKNLCLASWLSFSIESWNTTSAFTLWKDKKERITGTLLRHIHCNA